MLAAAECRPPEPAKAAKTLVNRHHDRSRSVDVRRPRPFSQGSLRRNRRRLHDPDADPGGAIPHALAGKDVLGIAQTGTGKTAAFVLPMITRLEKGRARARMPRTLILEPTRELAAQVEENFTRYGKNHKLNIALLIGGVSFDEQEQASSSAAPTC